jgi:protein-S-isoprenylcysteine O-methyltransferase Ste14
MKNTAPKARTDHADVLTLPPVIPAVAVSGGALAHRYAWPWPLPGSAEATMQAAYSGFSLLLAAVAGVIFASSLWPFWKTGQNPEPHTPTNALYTGGIYRYSRNPIYLGFLISQVAIGLQWNNGWIVALTPATAAVLHYGIIKPEEKYLARRFGAAYDAYKKKVRRWL